MCSSRDNAALPALGCPIRESAGHRPFSALPRLIAAVHALLRLLVPRHPPGALPILTVIGSDGSDPVIPVSLATVQFSRSVERRSAGVPSPFAHTGDPAGPAGPVPQSSTACGAPARGTVAAGVAPARSGRRSSRRPRIPRAERAPRGDRRHGAPVGAP